MYVIPGIAPFPQVEQLALTSKLRLLGFSKDEFEANKAAQDFTKIEGEELGIIPAGIYGDGVVNTEDVYTLGAAVGVAARADLDADLVYRITKAYWEQAAKAAKDNPWLKDITLDYAVADGGLKLHPGALRYYDEIGVEGAGRLPLNAGPLREAVRRARWCVGPHIASGSRSCPARFATSFSSCSTSSGSTTSSCAGHKHLHTPHIDGLAARGVRFSRAYVQSTDLRRLAHELLYRPLCFQPRRGLEQLPAQGRRDDARRPSAQARHADAG